MNSVNGRSPFRGLLRRHRPNAREVREVAFVTTAPTGVLPYYDMFTLHTIRARIALLRKRDAPRRCRSRRRRNRRASLENARPRGSSERHPRNRQPLHHFRYKINIRD